MRLPAVVAITIVSLLCGCSRATSDVPAAAQVAEPSATVTLTQPIHLFKHIEVLRAVLRNATTQKEFALFPDQTVSIPLGEYGRAIFYHRAGSPTNDVKLVMDNMTCTNSAEIAVTLYEHQTLHTVMVAESRTWPHN